MVMQKHVVQKLEGAVVEQVTATDFAALAREREARSRAKGPAPVPLQSGAAPPPVRPTAAQA